MKMKSYRERCNDVLACVIQHGMSDPQIMVHLMGLIKNNLFRGVWSLICQIVVRYFRLTQSIICLEHFVDFIQSAQKLSEEQRTEYIRFFSSLVSRPVKAESFRYYYEQLVKHEIRSKSLTMINDAQQALTNDKGTDLGSYAGYDEMRQVLLRGMYDLDRMVSERTTEGNVREEMDDVLEEYSILGKRKGVVSTGFTEIDKHTGGFYPGELWLLVGYAGEGKTFSCINIGHNAVFVQGKNVVFITSETVRSVVRRRLIARHIVHLGNKGIDLTAWKKSELSSEALEVMREALADIKDHAKDYGRFELIQMPANATTDFVAAVLAQYQARFHIDLCILDSIHLLQSKKTRQSAYAELDDMLIDLKKTIVSHENGTGVPLISPWHTNSQGWEEAQKSGIYTKSALAKSSEAERQADVILTILRQDSYGDELRGSILKNRDGEELSEFYLRVDFNQGYICDSTIQAPEDIDLYNDMQF